MLYLILVLITPLLFVQFTENVLYPNFAKKGSHFLARGRPINHPLASLTPWKCGGVFALTASLVLFEYFGGRSNFDIFVIVIFFAVAGLVMCLYDFYLRYRKRIAST